MEARQWRRESAGLGWRGCGEGGAGEDGEKRTQQVEEHVAAGEEEEGESGFGRSESGRKAWLALLL